MAANDPYVILGISRDATDAEVRAAFRTAAKRRHPDTAGSISDSRSVRRTIDAYRILSDPVSRARYDATHRSDPVEAPVVSARRHQRGSTGIGFEARRRLDHCGTCDGAGMVLTLDPCPSCGGRAEVTVLGVRSGRVLTCRTCRGAGEIRFPQPCAACAGTGSAATRRSPR